MSTSKYDETIGTPIDDNTCFAGENGCTADDNDGAVDVFSPTAAPHSGSGRSAYQCCPDMKYTLNHSLPATLEVISHPPVTRFRSAQRSIILHECSLYVTPAKVALLLLDVGSKINFWRE